MSPCDREAFVISSAHILCTSKFDKTKHEESGSRFNDDQQTPRQKPVTGSDPYREAQGRLWPGCTFGIANNAADRTRRKARHPPRRSPHGQGTYGSATLLSLLPSYRKKYHGRYKCFQTLHEKNYSPQNKGGMEKKSF